MVSERIYVDRRKSALGLLLVLSLVFAVSVAVWLKYAPRFFTFSQTSYDEHWPHAVLIFFHIGGGTVALFLGLVGLWTGLRRQKLSWHKWLGRVFLIAGGIGVFAGMILSVLAPHEPRSLYVSTFVLALIWFGAALMAYRAIRNKRIEAHKEWMMQTYLLTVTFVLCRIAMQFPLFGSLGL